MTSASSSQAYQCELSLDREVTSYRKTKIVCTIGPACANVETLKQMIKNGMCIARLNFSHGTYDVHKGFIKLVRQAAAETGEKIAIALDTKGPEIRTGATVGNQVITVARDQTLIISTDDKHKEACCSEVVYVDYKFLARDVKPGQTILIADGVGVLTVKEIMNATDVKCVSLSEFSIGSKKNVCLPGVAIDLPALAPKDIEDIKFGMSEGVDIIFASFIRNASNVKELRSLLMTQEAGKNIKIISKIENFEGVTKIDEIIEAGDGIMVARGDLGMDLRAELLIAAQKMIIDRCNCASKPVICATQMMESMIKNPRPTRAEISDVYNAVLDGADAIMLSGESANGQYPAVVVDFMHKISQYAESTICRPSLHEKIRKCFHCKCRSTSTSGCCVASPCRVLCGLAISAADLALSLCASAIICVSRTGKLPRLLSGARPHCPIILVTCCEQIARLGHLHCGVVPYHCTGDACKAKSDSVLQDAVKFGIEKGIITSSCPQVIIVTGSENGDEKTDGLRVASVDVSAKKLL